MDHDDTDTPGPPKPPTTRVQRASGATRHPASTHDVDQIREALAELRRPDPTAPTPAYRYLTIRGITGDPRTQARLRTRILVAHRIAAASQPQVCRPDTDGLTLGIAGDDAADRITTLAAQIKRIRRRRDWAITTHPAGYQPPEPATDPPPDTPA